MNSYKAYIFDFDGVIKESVHVKSKAFVELYRSESKEFQKRVEEYHLANGGISRFVKFKVWNEWLGRSTSADSINELAQKFAALVVDNVVTSPYVAGAIDSILSANENALSFIATGTPDHEIGEILGRLNLSSSFHEVHGSSRNKSDIIRDIMERYNLSSSEVLFIGDAQTDYQAAIVNDLDFYLRETNYNSNWFLGKPSITYCEKNLKFLNEIINK